MRKLITLPFILTLISLKTVAQDSLIQYQEKARKPFIVNKKAYRFNERELIFKNPEALKLLNRVNKKTIASQILGSAGGGLIGYATASYLFGNKPGLEFKTNDYMQVHLDNSKLKRYNRFRGVLLGTGIALFVTAIPIVSSTNKMTKNAVDFENSTRSESKQQKTLKFQSSEDGIGLAFNF